MKKKKVKKSGKKAKKAVSRKKLVAKKTSKKLNKSRKKPARSAKTKKTVSKKISNEILQSRQPFSKPEPVVQKTEPAQTVMDKSLGVIQDGSSSGNEPEGGIQESSL